MNKNIKQTALHDYHCELGAKMVEFAGFDMPIQYPGGIVHEHNWVRENAGIFDVSHMGQVIVEGIGAREFLNFITPSDFLNMEIGECKYTVMVNEAGGIVDDLIVTCLDEDSFLLVINAGCVKKDLAWLTQYTSESTINLVLLDRSLIALQGPKAASVLHEICEGIPLDKLKFMHCLPLEMEDENMLIFRTGYTGEDGFEISLSNHAAPILWDALLQLEEVQPIGLGARDSLRLEAGLCLYGHDLNDKTSPVEAGLKFIMRKGELDCIGAERLNKELAEGTFKKRVGIKLLEKGLAREGAKIFTPGGKQVGELTSGGFSPTLKYGIGQGYIENLLSTPGTDVLVEVRNRKLRAQVHKTVFIDTKYKKD